MITWPKATLAMTGVCAAVVCGLSACNKAPSQDGPAARVSAASGPSTTPASTLAADLQEPPLEVPLHANNPEVAAKAQKYVDWIVEKAMPAGLHKPSFPDPKRTDQAALLQRYKYGLWSAAETRVATDAALKQQDQFYGKAPKGSYGRMADGLPKQSSDHK